MENVFALENSQLQRTIEFIALNDTFIVCGIRKLRRWRIQIKALYSFRYSLAAEEARYKDAIINQTDREWYWRPIFVGKIGQFEHIKYHRVRYSIQFKSTLVIALHYPRRREK